eukprot:SAG31_NODE_335_length_17509_cov_7.127972_4_plen_84_part_00
MTTHNLNCMVCYPTKFSMLSIPLMEGVLRASGIRYTILKFSELRSKIITFRYLIVHKLASTKFSRIMHRIIPARAKFSIGLTY